MRHLSLTVALALLVGAGPVFALCPEGLALRKIGVVGNADMRMAGSGADVYAVGWQCSSSACGFALHDELLPATSGTIVFEAGGVASGGGFEAFDQPLTFKTGISLSETNVSGTGGGGVIAYGCVQR